MPLMIWNGNLLIRYGNLAIDPACCCTESGCQDASGWSAVMAGGIALAKGDAVPCNAGCGITSPAPAWADEIWYGHDAVNDIQHWVWSESVDSFGDPVCQDQEPGYRILYNYDWCDCESGTQSHTSACCLAVWNGTNYVIDNSPFSAVITP